MPVYIRKKQNFTPQSLLDTRDEFNDEDYVQDPDQVRDSLPQPYRLIDKIVTSIFERAWNYISSREDERVAEATRDKPPQYECGYKLQDNGSACCMKASPDGGEIIVLGLPNGLAVVHAASQKTLDTYHESKMEIVSIHISCLAEHTYIVSTVDDMGVGRIFGVQGEHIFLVQTITEGDGSGKAIVSHCEVSKDAEFLGLCFENTVNNEVWLEMHKIPKDQLIKELEAASAKEVRRGTSSPVIEETENETAAVAADDEEQINSRSNGADETVNEEDGTGSPTPAAALPSGGDADLSTQTVTAEHAEETPASRVESASQSRSTHKFPTSAVILKVKQPQPVSGTVVSSPYTASKAIDGTGEIIGSGAHHLLSTQHLEQRDNLFQQMHQQHMQYSQQQQQKKQIPTFHFVSGGRLMPHGVSGTDPAGPITAIVVWWLNHPQLAFYSLVKPAKELEHKAELVWPLAAVPLTSAVSPCTSLLAIATQANNIIIWDKYMGQPRLVEHLSNVSGRISSLYWLPNIPQPSSSSSFSSTSYPPYRMSVASRLVVATSEGDMIVLMIGGGEEHGRTSHLTINSDIQKADEMFTRLLPVCGMPQLFISVRGNGQIYIQDVTTTDGKRSSICEVTFPPGFSLPTPWEPALAVGAGGSMLYIRGQMEQEPPPRVLTPPPSIPHISTQQSSTQPEKSESQSKDVLPPSTPPRAGSSEQVPGPGGVTVTVDPPPPVSVDAIFVFTLRSFPGLDKYRSTPSPSAAPSAETLLKSVTPPPSSESQNSGVGGEAGGEYMVHSTVERRMAALLSDRLRLQSSRKDVMQARWHQLKDELSFIKQMRVNTEVKQAGSMSSIRAK